MYSKPIEIATNTSVAPIAFQDDKADSRIAVVSYLIGADRKLSKQVKSYHIGNSLTDTTKGMLDAVSSSGGKDLLTFYKTICGCDIQFNWDRPGQGFSYPGVVGRPEGWSTRYEEVLAAKVDHLFMAHPAKAYVWPSSNMGNSLGGEAEYTASSLFRGDGRRATRCREQRRGSILGVGTKTAFPPSTAARTLWPGEPPFSPLRASFSRMNRNYQEEQGDRRPVFGGGRQ